MWIHKLQLEVKLLRTKSLKVLDESMEVSHQAKIVLAG